MFQRFLHRSHHVFRQLFSVVLQQFLNAVNGLFSAVAHLGLVTALLIFGSVSFGFLNHAVDFVLRQGRSAGDGHGLLLTGAAVLCRDMNDTVGVNVEGNLDLRQPARRRSNAGQFKSSQRLVVAGELTFPLVDLNQHGRLIVLSGRKDLGVLGRNSRVALNQRSHNAALGFDTQTQGGHVNEQNVLAVAFNHARLESCPHRHDLVGVHALIRLAATGQLFDQLGYGGHPGGATDHHHVVDFAELDAGVLDDRVERVFAAIEQVLGHFLELGSRELFVQVNRAVFAHRQVLQVDVRTHRAGQFLLGLFSGVTQTLQRDFILGQIHAILGLNLVNQPIYDALVPVVTTQLVIAVGGAHLNGGKPIVVLADFQQGHVEGAATQVEYQD